MSHARLSGSGGRLFIFEEGAMTIYSRQVQTEEKEDINIICEQFKPLVKKYARKYMYVLQDAEAEAWLALVRAVRTYDPETGVPLAGYLESQVKYRLLNLWKQEVKRRRQEPVYGDEFVSAFFATDNLEMEVERKEQANSIMAAIKQLPARQQRVIILNVIRQNRLAYIASKLGITIQAVSQLKKRAISRLKKQLI